MISVPYAFGSEVSTECHFFWFLFQLFSFIWVHPLLVSENGMAGPALVDRRGGLLGPVLVGVNRKVHLSWVERIAGLRELSRPMVHPVDGLRCDSVSVVGSNL